MHLERLIIRCRPAAHRVYCCRRLPQSTTGTLLLNKGSLSHNRQSLVDKAFLKMDKELVGAVTIAQVRLLYNAAIHPLVQKAEITEKEALEEFVNNFSGAGGDGLICREVRGMSCRNGTSFMRRLAR